MGKYSVQKQAELDLREIFKYGFESFGIEQAEQFQDELIERFNEIAYHPYRYQAVDDIVKGCRRCVYRRYSIYYSVEKDEVSIIRVLKHQDITKSFSDI